MAPSLYDTLKGLSTEAAEAKNEVGQAQSVAPTKEEQAAVAEIQTKVAQEFSGQLAESGNNKAAITDYIEAAAQTFSPADPYRQAVIARAATEAITGYGPIESVLNDPTVSEIIVRRFYHVLVERNGILYATDITFASEEQLRTIIDKIVGKVGRSINLANPKVDARLPDGSRVNATIPPITPDGATLTIRKFPGSYLSGDDYLRAQSLSKKMLTFLSMCVKAKVSMIVSGGTSTGKTTLLNMLSNYIPEKELIITIEDTLELKLNQPNVTRMEATKDFPIQELVKNSLRMRPDRIVVGEIRDGTIVDMFSAMSTGHEGSLSTVHANNPKNLVNSRIPILFSKYSGFSFSIEDQMLQISESLMLIVHITRLDSGRRVISHITHINGLTPNNRVKLEDIFVFNQENQQFEATGIVPKRILLHAKHHGVTIPVELFEQAGGEET